MTDPGRGVDRERLDAAKRALVDTGYFTADQVGDDVAPRITELNSHHRQGQRISEDVMLNAKAMAWDRGYLHCFTFTEGAVSLNDNPYRAALSGVPTDAEDPR